MVVDFAVSRECIGLLHRRADTLLREVFAS
jgi:hypothetical protein